MAGNIAVEEQTIELDGIHMHYAHCEGTGPTLMLLHGITGRHQSYSQHMLELGTMSNVYALDLRGHGLSSHVPGMYRVIDYAQDVCAFIQQVIGEPVIIAGHSLGGLVAAWIAAKHKGMVRGILLEEPPFYGALQLNPEQPDSWFAQMYQILNDHAQRDESIETFAQRIGQNPGPHGKPWVEEAGAEAVRQIALQWHRLDPGILEVTLQGKLMDQYDLEEILPAISCPAHLLAGEQELGGLSTEDVTHTVALIPNCTYAIIADAGHGINYEKPIPYRAELTCFLQLFR